VETLPQLIILFKQGSLDMKKTVRPRAPASKRSLIKHLSLDQFCYVTEEARNNFCFPGGQGTMSYLVNVKIFVVYVKKDTSRVIFIYFDFVSSEYLIRFWYLHRVYKY